MTHLCLHDHLGRVLEVKAQAVRESTQTDRREEIDGETGVAGVVRREHALEHLCHVGVVEPLAQVLQTHVLREFLQ